MTSNAPAPSDLPPPERQVLLLTPSGADASLAASVLLETGIHTRVCPDIVCLCDVFRQDGAGVLVIAVEALEGGRHLPLIDALRGQPRWSDVPVILLTSGGGEKIQTLLREYLSTDTSITFIERPLRPNTLTSVVNVALRTRARQHQLRDAMAERERLLREAEAAREDALHAGRMKDEFLTTLSHELRTPLNAILGWAQILRCGDHGISDYQEGLNVIERNARAQTRLIEDLLDMSRMVAGKVRLDVQLLSPASFVDAAIETVAPAAEARGIRIIKVLDPQAGPVSGDAGRLQQVVWNLLTNATKFTPKGGKVVVKLERVNSHVEISVADTGQGVSPDFLPHIFDRFKQADGSTTRRHAGLGLGLSIAKQLVELHGGAIRVDSPGKGMGSTFTVDLPLAVVHKVQGPGQHRVHPQAPSTAAYAGEVRALGGVTVLVVDDEPDARRLITRILEQQGADVVTAASAEEGLSILASGNPDVIVSDVGMPEVDGYEFLRRARLTGSKVPAIALTAFARSEDRTRALLAGFAVHVAKPVEAHELLASVASAAGRAGA